MPITRFYMLNAFDKGKTARLQSHLNKINPDVIGLQTEKCFHIETDEKHLTIPNKDEQILRWILKEPQENDHLMNQTQIFPINSMEYIFEIGPRLNFSTADSTNSVNICQSVGLDYVKRIEISIKYKLTLMNGRLKKTNEDELVDYLSDRMTQCRYTVENIPKESFYEKLPVNLMGWYEIPVMMHGRSVLEDANRKLGLAFDDWDLEYYTNLFKSVLKRNPTSVELFDCAQSNSEHSRHWFFKGKMTINDKEESKSLIQMIIDTQRHSNDNNTIKFSDNSSAIKGFKHFTLRPTNVCGPGLVQIEEVESDLIFTAETHNMPTAVAPFSGATTGTGGRIRDVQGVGRGGLTIAGTAGYCVGNLHIPGYKQAYENEDWSYPPTFASALKIIIEASNGASDYGNKFGEPVISGFAISYGIQNFANERDEYVKPIMFSGGLGTMDAKMTHKNDPEKGMLLAKIGGPVYRIGVGGGAASSVEVQGDNCSKLDFNAVQRGDAEMENKMNRVVRACIEMGAKNPIVAIHDQGAGGNGNVLKELVEPGYAGAIIFSREFQLGDPTITALELWGAEYQENNAILVRPEDIGLMENICAREKCPINFVGMVTGNGFVSLIEAEADYEKYMDRENRNVWGNLPFDMHLEHVLGQMPQKEYILNRKVVKARAFDLSPVKENLKTAVKNVLSVLSVGSKRFLTNKVDRCVTGLIAQQQCVGPLHTPLSDYAITAVSHFGFEGIATSIGTQPIKGLLSARAGARMSVAEALSNLVFAGISELADVKCSGNWMWAAKLPGEGAKLYDACKDMCEIMAELNIAVDGGKDSLSMAARIGNETVKSPGTLVISTYAPCPDIRVKVTPNLKSNGILMLVLIEEKFRLGGSVLAQCYNQQGNNPPDLEKTDVLKNAFNATQKLLKEGKLLSGHDISDGGLFACILEMASSGMCGVHIELKEVFEKVGDLDWKEALIKMLFAEECGWVIEVDPKHKESVVREFREANVPIFQIGKSYNTDWNKKESFTINLNKQVVFKDSVWHLTKLWERTSYELEKLQMNEDCAVQEYESLDYRTGPIYVLNYKNNPSEVPRILEHPVRVAVIREEGTNGDREMIACLLKANFEVHDVAMTDLLAKKTSLDQYRGVVFPGGFSYADTLGSAKGWAASIIYSDVLAPQFKHFKDRKDTFSLGVCNGCQLMSLIGWVGGEMAEDNIPNVALLHNVSGRFECRWSTMKIKTSKAVMLRKLQGSILGCWIAHGEGRFSFKNKETLTKLDTNRCISMQYVDDKGHSTELYPMNPNGSPHGIAAVCSEDGRHLAMMPHPERCSKMWQWPYIPEDFIVPNGNCPWQLMFDEAYVWCTENTD